MRRPLLREPLGERLRGDLRARAQIAPEDEQNEKDEKRAGDRAQREHIENEPPRAHARLTENIQVLRTSERREHRSPHRRDILKREKRKNEFLPACRPEKDDRYRHEDDQRYVVRHEHRREKDGEDEKKAERGGRPHPRRHAEKRDENVLFLEALEHGQHQKKRRQSPPVDIGEQPRRRRRYEERDHCRQDGDGKHRLFFYESPNTAQDSQIKNAFLNRVS